MVFIIKYLNLKLNIKFKITIIKKINIKKRNLKFI